MKLKTKLTLGVSVLVLVVVLAVNLVYLAGLVQQQTQEVYTNADAICRGIYSEMSQELTAAHAQGTLGGDQPAALAQFFRNLADSPPLNTLLNSAISSPNASAVRDVALIAPDGSVVLDSNPGLVGQVAPQRPLLSEVTQASAWGHFKAIFAGEQIYSVALATQVGSQPLGTIAVGVDTVLLRQAMLGKIRVLAVWGAVIVLLATLLALALAEFILSPVSAISAQLDRLEAPQPPDTLPELLDRRDEFGQVSSKIQRLGRQIADVRQIYSTLQENVSHVLEGMEEGLLLFDAQGQSVMASAATPRLLGLDPGEIAGQPVEALFAGASSLDRAVRLAVRQRVAMPQREAERHAGGRPLLARLDLVRDRNGEAGSLLTVRDPEPVRRLENELEVARRLSAVGRLTRGVAHEVKNPLNAMAIHLDLLREKARRGPADLQPHIEVIRREIERLDRVVRTFLDFSRPVELQLVVADLGELVRGVGRLVEAAARDQGVDVVVRTPPTAIQVWLDHDLIEQALLNIVNNGIQAMREMMPPGETAGRPPRLELEVSEFRGHAVVRVCDQGPGVAADIRDKVFDLYFTTRAEGTGTGLSVAARIMQLHHGSIELEPRETGSSFVLRLPLRTAGEDAQ